MKALLTFICVLTLLIVPAVAAAWIAQPYPTTITVVVQQGPTKVMTEIPAVPAMGLVHPYPGVWLSNPPPAPIPPYPPWNPWAYGPWMPYGPPWPVYPVYAMVDRLIWGTTNIVCDVVSLPARVICPRPGPPKYRLGTLM